MLSDGKDEVYNPHSYSVPVLAKERNCDNLD